MSDRPSLKIGDRVHIDGRSGVVFVVVDINEETHSVSVLPESEVVQAPFDTLTSVDPKRSSPN